MDTFAREVTAVITAVNNKDVVRATKYLAPNLVVTVTRPVFKGTKAERRIGRGNFQAMLKVGRPNYAERAFIKACKKAGEPFPVKKIQLKHLK